MSAAMTPIQTHLPDTTAGQSELQLIKDAYAKGATDTEFKLFVEVARRRNLDILANQICLIGRWDSHLNREVKRPQVTIDGLRLIAERTGAYCPGRAPVLEMGDDGLPVSATAFIRKLVAGEWFEISATAYYSEFVPLTKNGTPTPMWRKMPRLMLAKCAEALALRRAFPAECSGLYTDAEMGQAGPDADSIQPGAIDAELEPDEFERAVPPDDGWQVSKATKMKLLDLCAALETGGVTEAQWRKSVEQYAGPGKRSLKDLTPDSAARFIQAASKKLQALRSA